MPFSSSVPRTALLIAHPAHELLLHAWLYQARPIVHILTEGASFGRLPRINQSTKTFTDAGCKPGAIYGRLNDQDLYQSLLTGQRSQLIEIAVELANALVVDRIDQVVVDAAEGQILTHDVWRAIVDTSVAIASDRRNQCIECLEFPLEHWNATDPQACWKSTLNIEQQSVKRRCVDDYRAVTHEIDLMSAELLDVKIQFEYLRPSECSTLWLRPKPTCFGYELHGLKQVAAGRYRECVRFIDHVLPLFEELESLSGKAFAQDLKIA
jgi:hypothetical protein